MKLRTILLMATMAAVLILASGVALAASKTASQTTDGDTLTSTVRYSTVDRPIVVTLTEDSRSATFGPTNVVIDSVEGKVKSIEAPDFDCTKVGDNRVECARKEGNTNPLTTIKIKAKPQGAGVKTNRAQDSYQNDIVQSFRVRRHR